MDREIAELARPLAGVLALFFGSAEDFEMITTRGRGYQRRPVTPAAAVPEPLQKPLPWYMRPPL